MEAIASIVAVAALFIAAIHRFIEQDREDKKRVRVLQRTNEKPWQRSNR